MLAALSPAALISRADATQWGADYLPNVPVVDQDGRELKFYDDVIRGKLVVVSFIYLSCRDLCPLMTARLARLQDELGESAGRDVFFVSITIEPEKDTPAKLKEHAEAFRAGPGWTFLTGRPEDINLIRHKLGERSKQATDHRSEVLLGNDRTGSWAKDSVFADLGVLANNVRSMDQAWLDSAGARAVAQAKQVALAKGQPASPELPGSALFLKTCGSCHTIGKGDRVGPDLAGLLARRDRAWVAGYIAAPDVVRARNDQIAVALSQKYRGARMPNLGMSEADIDDLLAYLEAAKAVQ